MGLGLAGGAPVQRGNALVRQSSSLAQHKLGMGVAYVQYWENLRSALIYILYSRDGGKTDLPETLQAKQRD